MKYMLLALLFFSVILIGCGKEETRDHNQMNQNDDAVNSEIVREGEVNVATIDENKDTRVYQCPMSEHYHVISDESGPCPLCKMDMVEYSVEEAQENYANRKQ